VRYGLAPLQARQGTCPLRMVWMGGWAPTNGGGVSSTGAADVVAGCWTLESGAGWTWTGEVVLLTVCVACIVRDSGCAPCTTSAGAYLKRRAVQGLVW